MKVIYVLFIVLLVIKEARFLDYHVSSVSGSDLNSGTSINTPFRTIGKAKKTARPQLGSMTENINIFIHPGIYNETLSFDYQDSAKDTFAIIYRNYDPKKYPIISGGKRVMNWEWVASRSCYRSFVGKSIQSRQLFVNNEYAIRARGEFPSNAEKISTGFLLPSGTNWYTWKNKNKVELVRKKNWVQMRCPVDDISLSSGNKVNVTMTDPCWKNVKDRPQPGNHSLEFDMPVSWVENALELLTDENEWYLDDIEGYLYYKPKTGEPIEKSFVFLPTKEKLIFGDGSNTNPIKNIEFQGLIFDFTTWNRPSSKYGFPEWQANSGTYGVLPTASIQFTYAKNIKIKNCAFRNLGGTAIWLGKGSQQNIIENNVITRTSSHGVHIGDIGEENCGSSDQTVGNIIRNNKLFDLSVDYPGAPAIFLAYCDSCQILHNDIREISYSGISVGWGWHSGESNYNGKLLIANNFVNGSMGVLRDGGSFYALGVQTVGTSILRHNVFTHQKEAYGAIYFDNGSKDWEIYENVVLHNVMTLMVKGGTMNFTRNYWEDKGKFPHSMFSDHYFWLNGDHCYPCSGGTCGPCGPIVQQNNHVVSAIGEVPDWIVKGAGLKSEIFDPLEEEYYQCLRKDCPVVPIVTNPGGEVSDEDFGVISFCSVAISILAVVVLL